MLAVLAAVAAVTAIVVVGPVTASPGDCTDDPPPSVAIRGNLATDGELTSVSRQVLNGGDCLALATDTTDDTNTDDTDTDDIDAATAVADSVPVRVSVVHRDATGRPLHDSELSSADRLTTRIAVRDASARPHQITADGPRGPVTRDVRLGIPLRVEVVVDLPAGWSDVAVLDADAHIDRHGRGLRVTHSTILFPPATDDELVVEVVSVPGRGVPTVRVHATPLTRTTLVNGVTDRDRDSAAVLASLGEVTADGASDLADGASQLADGLDELSDGTGQIADRMGDAADGASDLAAGMRQLTAGTQQLRDGNVDLADGLAQLAAGAQELAAGMDALATAVEEAADEAEDKDPHEELLGLVFPSNEEQVREVATAARMLADGAAELAAGLAAAADGSRELADGSIQLADGSVLLADGVADMADGLVRAAEGLAALHAGSTEAADGAGMLADGATELPGALDQVATIGDVAAERAALDRAIAEAGRDRADQAVHAQTGSPSGTVTVELVAAGRTPPGPWHLGAIALLALTGSLALRTWRRQS
jgi:X-X-X-Leu-X-X-Gly heptad repeat protein